MTIAALGTREVLLLLVIAALLFLVPLALALRTRRRVDELERKIDRR